MLLFFCLKTGGERIIETTHQLNQSFCISDFFQIHGNIVVKSASGCEQDVAAIFHNDRQ